MILQLQRSPATELKEAQFHDCYKYHTAVCSSENLNNMSSNYMTELMILSATEYLSHYIVPLYKTWNKLYKSHNFLSWHEHLEEYPLNIRNVDNLKCFRKNTKHILMLIRNKERTNEWMNEWINK
jgi:hypothetical protein